MYRRGEIRFHSLVSIVVCAVVSLSAGNKSKTERERGEERNVVKLVGYVEREFFIPRIVFMDVVL